MLMPTLRCLVTGGAGFIGSHLTERLLDDGHEVVVFDNFSNGRRENLAAVMGNERFRLVEGDINDAAALGEAIGGADWIFHLAALADIVPSITMPAKYFRANVDGTFAVLEAARAAGVKRLVYAASSSCYGIPDVYPTPETAPIRTHYPYALTKYIGEEMLRHWAAVYDLPAVAVRIFNAYGPRVRTTGTYGAVFGVFLAQKLVGKPFTVVGDGTQRRDFVYVTDVVDAFVRAAASDKKGEVWNLGTGNPPSVNDLVRLLGGGEVVHLPKRPGEPDITQADSSKIRRELGWEPKVSFEQGVANMLSAIEAWRGAPVWTPELIDEATKEWFHYLR